MDDCFLKKFIDKKDIDRRVNALAEEINGRYAGKKLVMAAVLNGAFMFCADLARKMAMDTEIDFIRVSSYGNSACGRDIKIVMDMKTDIKDRHVLLVEDIVDSGRTMQALLRHLRERKPASLALCALINKGSRRVCPVTVDMAAFTFDNDYFLVGYGLDYAGKYRHLESIFELIFDQKQPEIKQGAF